MIHGIRAIQVRVIEVRLYPLVKYGHDTTTTLLAALSTEFACDHFKAIWQVPMTVHVLRTNNITAFKCICIGFSLQRRRLTISMILIDTIKIDFFQCNTDFSASWTIGDEWRVIEAWSAVGYQRWQEKCDLSIQMTA